MRKKSKLLKAAAKLVSYVLVATLTMGNSASAGEITVSSGEEFQSAEESEQVSNEEEFQSAEESEQVSNEEEFQSAEESEPVSSEEEFQNAGGTTVSNGKEFLEAVEKAQSSGEPLIVNVTAGSEITLDRYVRLYSNTTINADGATIHAHQGNTLFVVEGEAAASHIEINGGTWNANGDTFIAVTGADDVTVKNATINVANNDFLATIFDSKNVILQDCAMNGASILIAGGSANTIRGGNIRGTSKTSIQIKSDNTVVDGTAIDGSGDGGIRIDNAQGVIIKDTQIKQCDRIGIESVKGGNHTIENNTVTNSGYRGISVDTDENSTISGNKLNGSAVSDGYDGEGLVVDNNSKGTQIINNTVQDTKGNKSNCGNGIIVNRSVNITVSGNTVKNSNNHGIQVSYNSSKVTVSGNNISASGRMGISVTRGSQADLKNNYITGSTVNGITFDGSKENTVSGSIENCTVTDSGEAGIWIEGAHATMNENTISNSVRTGGSAGMTVKGSEVTAKNNKIYQDAVDSAHGGIQVVDKSKLIIEGNIISNFGSYGVFAPYEQNCKVSGSDNQVNLSSGNFQTNYAYDVSEGYISKNSLTITKIDNTTVEGSTSLEGSLSGVVIGNKRIETVTDNANHFTVTYAETNPSGVIVYTQDANRNIICLQAPVNYNLKGSSLEVPDEVNVEEIRAFVSRLYTVALSREAEEDGLEDWTNHLAMGRRTGAEVAWGFFFSEEFTNKKLSDEEYVDTLYRTMFDREADGDGKAGWLKDLYNGASREYVYHGFAESEEFADLCGRFHIKQGSVDLGQPRDQNIKLTEFVSRVYYIALVRKSLDEAGINDWCGRILRGQKPADVVWGIVFSKECTNRGLNDEEFVTMLYKTYFDRDAALDQTGFNDWIGRLKEGASREDVVKGFSDSKEFANLVNTFGL